MIEIVCVILAGTVCVTAILAVVLLNNAQGRRIEMWESSLQRTNTDLRQVMLDTSKHARTVEASYYRLQGDLQLMFGLSHNKVEWELERLKLEHEATMMEAKDAGDDTMARRRALGIGDNNDGLTREAVDLTQAVSVTDLDM